MHIKNDFPPGKSPSRCSKFDRRDEWTLLFSGVRILFLQTVNVIRKYSKYLDVAISLHSDFDLLVIVPNESQTSISVSRVGFISVH